MRKLLGYILSPVYFVYFYLMLLIFHPVMDFGIRFISDNFRKRTVEILNLLLIKGLVIIGVRPKFYGKEKLPAGRPLIVVANHSSLLDIPPVVLVFKDYYPRFISKKELGRGIPSISHNLRYGGSALIDRDSGAQAVKQILLLGKDIEKKKHAVCIYPEGTRSKDGKMKKFQSSGILTLLKAAPSAVIIPFAISGHYELHKYGNYPLNVGTKVSYTVLDPIEPSDFKDKKDIVPYVEKKIREAIGQEIYQE
ncbi:MAG: 1-acyl-sn-glycerol-3-phosphate acyltransferase [Chlorobi bacterium]|nr:1-acyl-sn-glycerol-3-phosphate acyltransferase [Chlorobiota bacterium]